MPPFDEDYSHQDKQQENNIFDNQGFNQQEPEVHPVLIGQNQQTKQAQDPLHMRADNAYQILATGILRANQSRQDLQARIEETTTQITQYQHRLVQLGAQLQEECYTAAPQSEYEVMESIRTMQGFVREAHYNTLLMRLNELRQANYASLPETINAMRAELDIVEARTQKIKVLEGLKEAYKSHQYFQSYYERADQEFRSILAQY